MHQEEKLRVGGMTSVSLQSHMILGGNPINIEITFVSDKQGFNSHDSYKLLNNKHTKNQICIKWQPKTSIDWACIRQYLVKCWTKLFQGYWGCLNLITRVIEFFHLQNSEHSASVLTIFFRPATHLKI